MEEIQTPTKKVKKNTGKRDATIARTENGLLHRRAAREAMKLIEDVKRNELGDGHRMFDSDFSRRWH